MNNFKDDIETSINEILKKRKLQPDFNTKGVKKEILGTEFRLNIRELNPYDFAINVLAKIHNDCNQCLEENKPLYIYIDNKDK